MEQMQSYKLCLATAPPTSNWHTTQRGPLSLFMDSGPKAWDKEAAD